MTATQQNKRRVSYVIPAPEGYTPPWLNLPAFGTTTDSRPSPLLSPKAVQANGTAASTPTSQFASRNPFAAQAAAASGLTLGPAADIDGPTFPPQHPRHRLGVSGLALDTTTVLDGEDSPGGILYTGGRDGLVASWELHVPHTKRRGRCYRPVAGRGTGTRVRWERIGDGGADWDGDEDDNDSLGSTDSDDDDFHTPTALDTNGSGGKQRRQLPFENRWEVDKEAIARQSPPATTFRESVQTHTDWVNAMVLCNMNQTVITASSDRTIRAWSPHVDEAELSVPALIGHHTDYVRSLAFAKQAGVLFSGALDRDISVWDINEPRPNQPVLKVRLSDIDDHGGIGAEGEWGSIYALGVDPLGQTLAAGTPERVVRLWDPRTGDRSVTKLVGHTECVRSILLSDDGRYMLTGSSDTTIKLWSVGEHRCLHTFNHHTSSVWALHSNHPNLERFYSGSRDGHLCVVDVEQCGDISEGECVVLAREGDGPRPGHFESKTGDEAIRSIVSMDDKYVWTATSSSDVRRWRDVGRRVCRMDMDLDGASYGVDGGDEAAQPLVQARGSVSEHPASIIDNAVPLRNKQLVLEDDELTRIESRDSRTITFAPDPKLENGAAGAAASPPTSPPGQGLPSTVRDRLSVQGYRRPTGASVNSAVSEASQQEEFALNGIPYESLVSLGQLDSPYSFGFPGAVHSTASLSSAQHGKTDEHEAGATERNVNPVTAARRAYEDRDVASEAKPFRSLPDAVIAGSPGLIRSLVLNDRMHVLTLNTSGEVAVWHLIQGICLGRFAYKDVAEGLELERGVADAQAEIKMHPQEVLELVQRRIEGKNSVLPWCQVDTKVGQITVHLEGDRVFAAEILNEEVGVDVCTPEDGRPLNIGKVVLGNLFHGLIKAEEVEINSAFSASPTTQSSSLPSISRSPAPTHIAISPAISSPRHRQRALSSTSLSSSSGMTPSINIAGLATRASRAAIRPEAPFGQSAPAASGWLTPGNLRAISTNSGTPKSSGDAAVARDYFSVRKPDTTPTATPPTPADSEKDKDKKKDSGLLSKKFKAFGKKKTPEPQMTTVVESKLEETPPPNTDGLSDRDRNQLLFLDALRSRTFTPPASCDVPAVAIPASTAVIISEQSQADGAYFVTYRSQVSSTERDMEPLEMNSPFWLLNFLFNNSTPEERKPPKIPLILCPAGEPATSPKALKVQASRTARVRGVLEHLQTTLAREEGRERGMSDASNLSGVSGVLDTPRRAPEDTMELLCGNTVADPNMKVATLKHYYWRGGVDMVLQWRVKNA